jgi:hypothetical protein
MPSNGRTRCSISRSSPERAHAFAARQRVEYLSRGAARSLRGTQPVRDPCAPRNRSSGIARNHRTATDRAPKQSAEQCAHRRRYVRVDRCAGAAMPGRAHRAQVRSETRRVVCVRRKVMFDGVQRCEPLCLQACDIDLCRGNLPPRHELHRDGLHTVPGAQQQGARTAAPPPRTPSQLCPGAAQVVPTKIRDPGHSSAAYQAFVLGVPWSARPHIARPLLRPNGRRCPAWTERQHGRP